MTDPTDTACSMHEDAVALALHVLEPDEEIAVRTHLPHCRSCRATVRSTELVMGGLGMSIPQVDPPARLRASIVAEVARTPQEVSSPAPDRRTSRRRPMSRRAARDAVTTGDRPGSRNGADRRPAGGRRRMAAAALALAAVLGFGGLTTYAVQVHQQRDAQLEQTRALADLLTRSGRPGAVRATLVTDAGQAVAAVVASSTGPTVVAAGLTPNQRDTSTYVLWGITSNGPQPLAAFDVVPGTAAYPLAAADNGFSAYAISLEPGRVMPATPTTVVASGPSQT